MKLNKAVHRLEDFFESYSAAVPTSLHDSKGSYQLNLLHEAKPTKNTAIVASVAAFAQSQVYPMRAPERARSRVVQRRGSARPQTCGR